MKTNIFWAYAIIWIAVSVAVIAGLIITKNANCLWGFLIPAMFELKVSTKKEDDDKEKED